MALLFLVLFLVPTVIGSRSFHEIQQKWMEQLVGNAETSDAVFVIGTERQKMYGMKALLANMSPVLKEKLYGDDEHAFNDEECIEYLEIEPVAFESVLRASFGIDPRINAENAMSVIRAAQILKIPELETACNDFLNDHDEVKHVVVPGLLVVAGAFSHCSIHKDVIWISGTIGAISGDDGQNRLIEGGVRAQTLFILESIQKILIECGSSFEYITNLRVFIDNNTKQRYQEMNAAYVEFFESRKLRVCSRITVGAQGLALGADVEIDGSAIVPGTRP